MPALSGLAAIELRTYKYQMLVGQRKGRARQGHFRMFPRIQFFERINITQRQAVLAVLFLYFLGAILTIGIQLLTPTSVSRIYILGGVCGAILFGSTWIMYFKYNWEPVRYFAAIALSLIVGFFLPEPFVTQYA